MSLVSNGGELNAKSHYNNTAVNSQSKVLDDH